MHTLHKSGLTFLATLAVAVFLWAALPFNALNAQDENLLTNGGMEPPYNGQGASDLTAPNGWRIWYSGTQVVAFPHTDKAQVKGGVAAWNMNKGFQVFTAGGYQQVSGIKPGSIMRAIAHGLIYTCNDQTTSCINGSGQRVSDRGSGAYFKIGIDPSGGTNPASSQIVWSNNALGFDAWTAVGTDATACNTTVTLFLFATQTSPMAINNMYWDDASIKVQQASTTNGAVTCGSGGTGGTVATTAPPTQALAPFVQRQPGEQPDGSIVHTVVRGDTLAAIAVAYKTTLDEIRKLNGFTQPGAGTILQIGQKIIVRGPTEPVAPVVVAPIAVGSLPTIAVSTVSAFPEGQPAPVQPVVIQPTIDPNAPTTIAMRFTVQPVLNSTQLAQLPPPPPATPTPAPAVQPIPVALPTVTPVAVAQLPPAAPEIVAMSPTMAGLIDVFTQVIQLWLRFSAAG
jgi:LysM repeat protein